MKELAASLAETVAAFERRLTMITHQDAARRSASGVWTKKELLGHLIDSAANNHQRFVRLQLGNDLALPKYDQEAWVRVQHYQSTDWLTLIELWTAYNLHLARLIAGVEPSSLAHMCRVGENGPVTLRFLMEDYLVHMKHHLKKLLETEPS